MSSPYGDGERHVPVRPYTANVWKRGLIMLLVMFCVAFAQSVLFATTVLQFLWMLVTGERNAFIAQFGRSLGLWYAESARFLSADTDEKPFPWKAWPTS